MRLTREEHPAALERFRHIKPARGWRVPRCSRACPGTRRLCTLARDHRGPHVAHGAFGKVMAVWDSGTPTQAPAATGPLPSTNRVRTVRRARRAGGFLDGLKGLMIRAWASPEEVIFFGLFVAFVGFAAYWIYLIMG